MVDLDQQFIQQQSEILREIRDELRSSHASMVQPSAGGMPSARPGQTFSHAQAMADRTMSGQWNTLGWSNAYSSSFRSSFANDLGALMGFRRAPNVLTQTEFEGLAGQSIIGRVSQGALGMVAPHFASQSQQLADEIYSNSSRFIRSGSNSASIMGSGFDSLTSRQLGRSIGIEALRDMRLSQQDYSTVTSLGMQSGQFNNVHDTDSFKEKVRELASATGDLTRALHMTVQEVGTAMGNLRMLGVGGVAQQRGVMMGMGAAGVVAGMTGGEMMAAAGSVASAGLGMGLSASTTMPMAASNMAMVRAMSQQGVISANMVAQGGGAESVMGSISAAQMRFASSQAGMFAFMGGGANGGNSYEAMMRGINATGGTMEGFLGASLNRVDVLDRMGKNDPATLFRSSVDSRLAMMGVTDTTSMMAQGLVQKMGIQAGMDPVSATVYARSGWSVTGRRVADSARLQEIRAASVADQKLQYDEMTSRERLPGRIREGMQTIEGGFASIVDRGTSWIESFGEAGRITRGIGAGISGLAATNIGFDDIAASLAAPRVRASALPMRMRYHNPTSGMTAAGGAVALTALTAVAASPLGWIGGTLATVGAGTVGMTGLSALVGNAGTTEFDDTYGDATAMFNAQEAIKHGNGSTLTAAMQIKFTGMKGEGWANMMRKSDMTNQTATEFRDLAKSLQVASVQNGNMPIQDVVNLAMYGGSKFGVPKAMAFADAGLMFGTDELMAGTGVSADSLGSPTTSRALGAYIDAYQNNPDNLNDVRRVARNELGGSVFDKWDANIRRTGGTDLKKYSARYRSIADMSSSAEIDRRTTAGGELARVNLASNSGMLSKADNESMSTLLKGDIFTALHDAKFQELAKKGVFGALMKDISGVASNEELQKMTAESIGRMYNIADPNKIAEAQKKNPGMLQHAIQASLLNSAGATKELADAAPLREADLLFRTSGILDAIQHRLNGDTTPAASK